MCSEGMCCMQFSELKFFYISTGNKLKGEKIMCGIFPNLALWGMTYPYNYISHLGGRYQACTMPFDWTPQQAFGVRNIFNPAYHAFSFMGALQNNFYGSFAQNYNMQNFMALGYNAGISCSIDSTISGTMGQVGKFVDDINSGIGSGKLTNEQKEKMEQLKKEAEAIQRRLQDLKVLKSNGANLSQVQEILDQINSDFRGLKAKAEALAEEIKKAQEAKQEDADEASSGGGAESDNDSVHEPTKDEKYEASKICSDIDNAIFGPGTDYDLLKSTMQKFTGDNVMTILDAWDKSYAKVGVYADDKNGFIETLMDDCEFGQKKEIATLLVDALEKRAIDLGIDVTAEVGAARNAMQPRPKLYTLFIPVVSNTDDICKTVNALISKIRNNSKTEKTK